MSQEPTAEALRTPPASPSPTPPGRGQAGTPGGPVAFPPEMAAPSVGRIVHYFDTRISGGTRPVAALITRVDDPSSGVVNLTVFPDAANDIAFLVACGRSADNSAIQTSVATTAPPREVLERAAADGAVHRWWAWPARGLSVA